MTVPPSPAVKRGEGDDLEVFGRLKAGVDVGPRLADVAGIAARLADASTRRRNKGIGAVVKPYTEEFIGKEPQALLYDHAGRRLRRAADRLRQRGQPAASPAAMRAKEVGIRSALGATRGGSSCSSSPSRWCSRRRRRAGGGARRGRASSCSTAAIAHTNPPFWIDIRIDGTVLAVRRSAVTLLASLRRRARPAVPGGGRQRERGAQGRGARGSSSFRGGGSPARWWSPRSPSPAGCWWAPG